MAAKENCCVPGCGSQNQILHKFPHPEKDPDRFRTWLYAVGGEMLSLENKYVFQYRCVCHLHFEARYRTWSKRLTCNAVPTLYLPEKSSGSSVQESVSESATQEKDKSSGSELRESVSESATQEKDVNTIINKCVLCDKKGITPSSEKVVLSRFPLNPAICRTWVQRVGLKELLSIPIQKLNETMFLCQKHFNPRCFMKKDNLRILMDVATPCTDLYYPPLTEEMMSAFCTEDQTGSHRSQTGSKAESINLRIDDSQDYNDDDVEYLDEDFNDKEYIYENVELNDDHGSHNVNPKIETKSSIDEIDNLFASYSVTFRKFPIKLQTMLKLDLAKLFARYEMKHAALGCSSDEQQQAEDDTPTYISLEETKKSEKRIKRNFTLPQQYITTNNPPEILTCSKSIMKKSQVSNKDTEGAGNKSSDKKFKLNTKAIIKKRVRDNEDNDNIVLPTNDQYQKPMKLRKLEEYNVDADTSRSQDTGAIILIIDRSSEKLTTESDKISQSQESAS